jgi:hypothetical protein
MVKQPIDREDERITVHGNPKHCSLPEELKSQNFSTRRNQRSEGQMADGV